MITASRSTVWQIVMVKKNEGVEAEKSFDCRGLNKVSGKWRQESDLHHRKQLHCQTPSYVLLLMLPQFSLAHVDTAM